MYNAGVGVCLQAELRAVEIDLKLRGLLIEYNVVRRIVFGKGYFGYNDDRTLLYLWIKMDASATSSPRQDWHYRKIVPPSRLFEEVQASFDAEIAGVMLTRGSNGGGTSVASERVNDIYPQGAGRTE
jgi:hypothetical protein